MTTNNPPIAAWAPSAALAKLASRHNNSPCVLTDGPAEFNDVALIRLSDYERLQAEYEEDLFCVRQDRDAHFGDMMRALEQVDAMKSECEELKRALSESQANDRQAMAYLSEVRAIVGGDDFPDMVERVEALQAECEKLRKDAERYQSLLEAVLREIPHRKGNRGNAPGHAHSVPGIWDEDNGALAGKECAWCKVWNEAASAMQEENK